MEPRESLCWASVRDGMEDSDALGGSRERGGEVMFIRGRLHQSDAVCCVHTYIVFSLIPRVVLYILFPYMETCELQSIHSHPGMTGLTLE